MANIDLLNPIKRGIKGWNEWRGNDRSNSEIDLRGAHRCGANLTEVDRTEVDLQRTIFMNVIVVYQLVSNLYFDN